MSDSLQPHELYSPWNSPGRNTGVGSLSLLQGIFPNQGSNPGLPHCGQILYQLSYKGSPRILEWVAHPFSRGSSQPRNQTGVSCIAGGFFNNWAVREALIWWAGGYEGPVSYYVRISQNWVEHGVSAKYTSARSWFQHQNDMPWKAPSDLLISLVPLPLQDREPWYDCVHLIYISHISREVFFLFWPHPTTCRILGPWPGVEPMPLAVEAWNPNQQDR